LCGDLWSPIFVLNSPGAYRFLPTVRAAKVDPFEYAVLF
jgi:hypothetical protein